ADIKKTGDEIQLTNHLVDVAKREYAGKKARLGPEVMANLERLVMLRSIDTLWQEHLDTMEHLRDSVRLRGYGQRDPLFEFQNEGFKRCEDLLAEIARQVAHTVCKVDVAPAPVNPPPAASQPVEKSDIGRN